MVGHPYQLSRVESLAQVLLQFTSGKTATLYGHYSTAPMHPLPFFQVFGEKVSMVLWLQYHFVPFGFHQPVIAPPPPLDCRVR